jgi:hypothetical protein
MGGGAETAMTIILRTLGIVIALAGVIDPGISVRRAQPIAVEIVSGATDRVNRVRERLLSELDDGVRVARSGEGDAVVVIESAIDTASIRNAVPVSAVHMTSPPNLRLVNALTLSKVVPGHQAMIAVDAEVQSVAGRKSFITVTQQGVPVGRIEHSWTEARRQRVIVPVVPVGTGTHRLHVSAAAFADESRVDDNVVETALVGVNRPLRVAFIEPRPSWAAGFVRRAVESDPAFEIASVVYPSRGIDVRTGSAPASLTASALERFDAIVVGAPEELKARDLEALRSFLAGRAGTVMFLPDRRPSGPYAGFISAAGFDEVLLDAPVTLGDKVGQRALRASELALPRAGRTGMRSLLSLEDGRAAIASWPVGSGSLIFSGALDAWRFRADADGHFAAFWRASIAAAALAAQPVIRVELDPPVIRPGVATRVLVRVRPTEFHGADGAIMLPIVSASATRLSADNLTSEPVRLWPLAEPGVFEGRLIPERLESYRIDVTAGRAQESALAPAATTSVTTSGDEEESSMVASATRGVVAPAGDLSPLVTHLKSIPRGDMRATLHPMRSGWWTLPFALALCGEWALRRRRGER